MNDLRLPPPTLKRREVPEVVGKYEMLEHVRCPCGAKVHSRDNVILCSQCSNAWLLEHIEYDDLSHLNYDGVAELQRVTAWGRR